MCRIFCKDGAIFGTIRTEMGIFSPVSVCICMAAVGIFAWIAEVDPKEANEILSLLLG